jgi:hypothetical protein
MVIINCKLMHIHENLDISRALKNFKKKKNRQIVDYYR